MQPRLRDGRSLALEPLSPAVPASQQTRFEAESHRSQMLLRAVECNALVAPGL